MGLSLGYRELCYLCRRYGCHRTQHGAVDRSHRSDSDRSVYADTDDTGDGYCRHIRPSLSRLAVYGLNGT